MEQPILKQLFVGGFLLLSVVLLVQLSGGRSVLGSTNMVKPASQRSILTEATSSTTAVGTVINVSDYSNFTWELATYNNASGTIKFACSTQDDQPSFGSTATVTNTWDYIRVYDTEDGSSINGDTGITFSGTNNVRYFTAVDQNYRWCTGIHGLQEGNLSLNFLPASTD